MRELPLRNEFYEEIGRLLDPALMDHLKDLPHNMTPVELLCTCRQWAGNRILPEKEDTKKRSC
jgi:hypothetical protein